MISVTSLSASSSGNSFYVRSDDAEILIDAGISAKKICTFLNCIGTDISNISDIFVTHEHIDHVKGLAVLAKKYGMSVHFQTDCGKEYKRQYSPCFDIISHETGSVCNVGGMKITSFFASHDSVACVGYVIETQDDKFGFLTDTGYIDKSAVDSLVGSRSVVLESNYDEKMLMQGCYPPLLKERIRSSKGHLSNFDCAAFARYLAERGTKNFMLSHLSQENNVPELALKISRFSLQGFEDVKIKVAPVSEPLLFI